MSPNVTISSFNPVSISVLQLLHPLLSLWCVLQMYSFSLFCFAWSRVCVNGMISAICENFNFSRGRVLTEQLHFRMIRR